MTPAEVVERAYRSCGKGCHYKLGKGGFNPTAPFPWSPQMECDCSGFALWCLGQHRQRDDGIWIGTTEIVHDAKNEAKLFVIVAPGFVRPSDLIVYPDKGGAHGHVGVVASVDTGVKTVIHCSHGNDVRTNDAIRETTPHVFEANDAILVRYTPLDLEVSA